MQAAMSIKPHRKRASQPKFDPKASTAMGRPSLRDPSLTESEQISTAKEASQIAVSGF